MRIVLKVSSNNEHCDGGCEFALVDLSPELAALALQRIAALREQKSLDPDVDETYYWAYFVEYFSPCVTLARTGERGRTAGRGWKACWMNLEIEEKEVVTFPKASWCPRARSQPWSAGKCSCVKIPSRSRPSRNMPAFMFRQ